ncbi:hypothetical protein CAPTEDRAFT_217430 [Capitella teleta]|uniref:Uncharacterized protein n=1 Tax=Capitella teleta TaxID=283909 RepID=R7TS80_CAPTE|nr:hypothetical protein CAPTEDRAFT_217430 [Capitella teleta]|eukprot:ELT94326.1 hypothetical protein CAPTEDRAFT_217430 [Capitella teleta]
MVVKIKEPLLLIAINATLFTVFSLYDLKWPEWNFNSSFKPGRHSKGVAEEFGGRDEEAGIAQIKGESSYEWRKVKLLNAWKEQPVAQEVRGAARGARLGFMQPILHDKNG